MPNPLLTLSYTLHMLATVILVGRLFVLSVLWLPAAGRALSPLDQAALLRHTLRRFQPLAWLSIAVLMATGLTQMAASPAYVGFLVLENRWSVAMFAKHLAFGAMVALAIYQTWVLAPALERQMLGRAARGEAEDAAAMAPQRRMLRLHGSPAESDWIGKPCANPLFEIADHHCGFEALLGQPAHRKRVDSGIPGGLRVEERTARRLQFICPSSELLRGVPKTLNCEAGHPSP